MKRRHWSHYINPMALDSSIIHWEEDHIFKPNIRMCGLTNMFVPIRMTRKNIYNYLVSMISLGKEFPVLVIYCCVIPLSQIEWLKAGHVCCFTVNVVLESMPGLVASSARLQSRCGSGLGSHLMLTGEGSASKLMLLAAVSPLKSSRLRRYSGFVSVGSHPPFLCSP